MVAGLNKAQVYYHRVAASTVIGTGVFSASSAAPVTVGGPSAPTNISVVGVEMSSGLCARVSRINCSAPYMRNFTHRFTWTAPTDTGDGTSALPVVAYYVQASVDYFNSVAENANVTTATQWTSAQYSVGVVVSFRVRAANLFNALAPGAFSEAYVSFAGTGCSDNARWDNASLSCLCVEGYQDLDSRGAL